MIPKVDIWTAKHFEFTEHPIEPSIDSHENCSEECCEICHSYPSDFILSLTDSPKELTEIKVIKNRTNKEV